MTPDPHPERHTFVGRGVVYVASVEDNYTCYWDLSDPPKFLEQGPDTVDARSVIEWGLERTPQVVIRPHNDSGVTYWAGTDEPHGEFRELPIFHER